MQDVNNARQSVLFRSIVLFVLAICTYLHVPLMSGERLIVPSYPTIALAPVLFLLVVKDLTTTDVMFIAKLTFILVLSIGLSPGYRYVDEKFLSLVQCVMAVGVAALAVRLMHQIGSAKVERVLLLMWLTILAGVILELAGVTRDASDAFRDWAFSSQYTVYDHDLRDLGLVGWARPKVFSVEPSHVTKFFVASINAWLLVRVTWTKAAVAAAATVVLLMIMGSPMLIVSAAMSLLIVMWDQRTSFGARATMVSVAAICALAFGMLYGGSTISTVAERVESIGELDESATTRPSSEQQRVVIPYLTLINTWLRSPLFGVGIGGKEVVAEQTTLRLHRPEVALGNNALAEIGVYLGIVGGALFVTILIGQFRYSGVRRVSLLLILIVLFSQLMGGFVSFQYWGFIALIWGAVAVADRASSAASPERPASSERLVVAHSSQ